MPAIVKCCRHPIFQGKPLVQYDQTTTMSMLLLIEGEKPGILGVCMRSKVQWEGSSPVRYLKTIAVTSFLCTKGLGSVA